ncbi:hypothetical protein C8J55DRAFT_17631 [Lentinula edodes]|uniref:Uncharacterized protein n=1 Tax=Lentinula lateritia TaxID=40482 RepID=A0A9W9E3X8_9AGAR|nr:hypothetical protein C8J55DRAFT_17631 [Lentinula edodes]
MRYSRFSSSAGLIPTSTDSVHGAGHLCLTERFDYRCSIHTATQIYFHCTIIMPRLSSTIAVAIIAFTAIGAVDASSLTTSDERVYSRHFARHHPAPRASNKHDVAIAGLETIGKTAVAGAELQGASTSEPQRRDEVHEIRDAVISKPNESGFIPPPEDVGFHSLHRRHLGKAVKFLEHAGKATEGAAVVGTATEDAKDSNEGRSLVRSDDHESGKSSSSFAYRKDACLSFCVVSLGKRRKSKKAKSTQAKHEEPKPEPKHEEPKHEEPKQEEPKHEEPKPANEGTNKHDVAVAGFQAAGEAAVALAGAQGSSASTPDTSAP